MCVCVCVFVCVGVQNRRGRRFKVVGEGRFVVLVEASLETGSMS